MIFSKSEMNDIYGYASRYIIRGVDVEDRISIANIICAQLKKGDIPLDRDKIGYTKHLIKCKIINLARSITKIRSKYLSIGEHYSLDHISEIADENYKFPISTDVDYFIDMLEQDQRSIIILIFYNDKSIAEISRILHIPYIKTRRLYINALNQLRTLMNG